MAEALLGGSEAPSNHWPIAISKRAGGPAKGAYLPTLDGWRAIAVALVLACHAVGPESSWRDASGALGVSIFFGISGYLICTRLLEERLRSGVISLRTFYIRRAFRILPPAFAYLAFVAMLGLLNIINASFRELTASAFFFRNYTPGNWYTSHFWSLAVEEHFYLFFPALLLIAGTSRTKWIALAISLATAIWRIVDTHYGFLTSHLPDGVYAAARTDFRLDGLMLGCVAAMVLHDTSIVIPRSASALGGPSGSGGARCQYVSHDTAARIHQGGYYCCDACIVGALAARAVGADTRTRAPALDWAA